MIEKEIVRELISVDKKLAKLTADDPLYARAVYALQKSIGMVVKLMNVGNIRVRAGSYRDDVAMDFGVVIN